MRRYGENFIYLFEGRVPANSELACSGIFGSPAGVNNSSNQEELLPPVESTVNIGTNNVEIY